MLPFALPCFALFYMYMYCTCIHVHVHVSVCVSPNKPWLALCQYTSLTVWLIIVLGIDIAPSSPKLGLAELKMVADITQKLIMQGLPSILFACVLYHMHVEHLPRVQVPPYFSLKNEFVLSFLSL